MQSSDLFKHHTFDEIKVFNENDICYIGHLFSDTINFNFKEICNSDQLYLLTKKKFLNKLIKFFGYKDYVLDILIVGGGNIGQNLSKLIESDEQQINLKILESNKERCDYLASTLKNILFFMAMHFESIYDEIKLIR